MLYPILAPLVTDLTLLVYVLQVDAFLLPPAGGGLDETKRRAALLARRTEWMALGIPVEEYPDSMRDDNLL